ncbi:MAG TPA: hypothetical protein VGG42_07320 [Acidobacteriaceae bacterium]|jgi:ribosomal protein S5
MKYVIRLALIGLLALPAGAQTFKNVPVVDTNCSRRVAANPDSHTRDCALKCAASGFGIITSDNQYLKFDAAGNQKILSQLKSSKETDHLRVNVSGTVQGDTLKVTSVELR